MPASETAETSAGERRGRAGANRSLEARGEELAERVFGTPAPRRRMLVIANPYATTVSSRLKNLVVYALQGRYDVEAVETEARDHATELSREAAERGVDVVTAFGGDGTINEVANGLAGSDTALAVVPGGSTNVFSRSLGIPNDVVDATEHLLHLADRFEPRRIDLGRANDRYFLFSSGVGIDAEVVRYVDRRPRLKARLRKHYFAWATLRTFVRGAVVRPSRVRVQVAGREAEGVTVVAQNSDPFTFYGDRAIRVAEGAGLTTGTLSVVVLRRAGPIDLPFLAPRLLSGRAATFLAHRRVEGFAGVADARVSLASGEPLALHVDGDYIEDCAEVRYEAAPGALRVVV